MKTLRGVPTLHTYRGLSITTVMGYRLGVLAKYLYLRVRLARQLSTDLTRLRRLKDSECDSEALIIAGGPSVKLLDAEKVQRLQRNGLHVFVVNMYCKADLARHVTPDYYVLADPDFFAENGGDFPAEVDEVWRFIRDHRVTPVLPVGATPRLDGIAEPLFFNNIGLQGWTKNINPTRPRGYSSMVAYSALAIALHFGYRKIYVAGIDNDMFKYLYRDPYRVLRYGAGTHHHPAFWDDHVVGQVGERNIYRGGIAAYFENVARVFGELVLFRDDRVVHVDSSTLVDAFRVIGQGDADIRLVNAPEGDQ